MDAMSRNIDVAVARAFLAVVETGSVTLAARQLNLTQGAISQQLRRLEELADHPLFVRAGRSIVPTPEAQRLVPAVTQFLAANDQLIAALRQPAFEGEVRFGAPYDIIGSYAPPILRRFSQALAEHPGDADVQGYGRAAAGAQGRRHRSGADDRARLRQGRRDPAQRPAGLDRSARRRRACPRSAAGIARRGDVRVQAASPIAALRKARRNWQAVCEVSNMEPVRATLEADLAVAPLLGHSIPESLEIIASGRHLPRLPMFQINLYEARHPSPAAHAFADHVRRSVAMGGADRQSK